MKNKKGQFYLVAAMIIIAILVGIFGITNSVRKSHNENPLQDLKKEIDIEISKNWEYAFQNALSDVETNTMWTNFSNIQINNSDGKTNLLFIFGDDNSTTTKGYLSKNNDGNLSIDVGNGFVILASSEGTFSQSLTLSGSTITVKEGDSSEEKIFNVEKGQHFYYVISKNIGGEKIIINN